MMQRAVDTLDHLPSIAQLEEIALEMNFKHSSGWKYLDVADCLKCGGCGWHWVLRRDGAESVVACDDCAAGRNMQKAPKGIITITMKEVPGCTYLKPGR